MRRTEIEIVNIRSGGIGRIDELKWAEVEGCDADAGGAVEQYDSTTVVRPDWSPRSTALGTS